MAVVNVGIATRPLAGQTVCGDDGAYWVGDERIVLTLADGLGHGPEAARASRAAVEAIGSGLHLGCAELFTRCDAALRSTRGAAQVVAIIERASGRGTIASVGNMRVQLLHDHSHSWFASTRGIVGAGYQNLDVQTVVLVSGDILIVYSDGLDEQSVPYGFCSSPDVPAAGQARMILDSMAHGRDDASVLVYHHG